MSKTTEGGSQTLGRGLEALTLIGESAAPLSVSELAGLLGVHRSMAYRLVKTFEQYGFVERNPAGELELGARLGALARNVAKSLQAAAAPHLATVSDELQMTALLVVFDGEAAVTLSTAEPRLADATVAQRPGTRHPIDNGAPGRVIRSMLNPEEYPAKEFEFSHDEVIPGLTSIAVPLLLPQGKPAAIAVIYPPLERDRNRIAHVLAAASARISASLGVRS
ncbi:MULTISPECIES: IclR family transcriptional regulator [Glutamicibacter]|jgi:DNA-binding IclR family transcriptional regulator|uniref:IclR family transcriptional regulator n=1 Tax=Glutamicibacter TaxID=1742989 RepID=UPI00195E5640|nr:helix-turn-helix domain-containing protein [Glutamicibacter nicotianae]MBM7769731.1 DNA-binding IclR family transcriptional regulator [Glutamicibacter nicotianae]